MLFADIITKKKAVAKARKPLTAEQKKANADKKRIARLNMTHEEVIGSNAKAALRMQQHRHRQKMIIDWAVWCFQDPANLARAVQEAQQEQFRLPSAVQASETIKLSDCTLPRTDGTTVDPGFKLTSGCIEVSFVKADGLLAGSLSVCQDASAAILTAGWNPLIYALARAVKEGKLRRLTKMFFMLATDGWPEDDILSDWWLVLPPLKLRYRGGSINRKCGFLFLKSHFDCTGKPLGRNIRDGDALTPEQLQENIKKDAWCKTLKILYKANIVGGSHNITIPTVLDVLSFWGAGKNDCILDVGFGTGSTTAISAVAIGAKAVGIEVRDDIFGSVYDVVSSIRGIDSAE